LSFSSLKFEKVCCDLCKSNDYRIRYEKPDIWLRRTKDRFHVVECMTCGMVYVNPRPDFESMSFFYPENYHFGRNEKGHLKRYELQKSILGEIGRMKILDIGCARGDFLKFLLDSGENFDAHGVDAFSKDVVDGRISFTKGTLLEVAYEESFFDKVMAWAVFEHLHSPLNYFEQVSKILKNGGELIILVTNSESIYGRYAYKEDVPRHLYHFSKETLKKYGDKVGLKLSELSFRDDIFDGRGDGALSHFLGRLVGVSWDSLMNKELRFHQKAFMKTGSILDKIVFAAHWEALLRKSGIMVAKFIKM